MRYCLNRDAEKALQRIRRNLEKQKGRPMEDGEVLALCIATTVRVVEGSPNPMCDPGPKSRFTRLEHLAPEGTGNQR